MNNPLLTMDQPAVTQAIADCKQKISDVLAQRDPHTWDSLIAPLEEDQRCTRQTPQRAAQWLQEDARR
ncbi:hypothetical protein ACTG13_23250 [Aeromonas hydrophila]|uniref:hypothetical protein n=1 Tax=Aeromonas hydrophila TaxID=644 RepID=UPI003F78D58E